MRRAFLAALFVAASATVSGCTAILGSFEVDNALSNDGSTTDAPDGAFVDGSADAAPCVDTDTARLAVDENNCGRCGRSCGGSACTGGACAPVRLIDSTSAVGPIAVNDTSIIFATADLKIQSCAKTGCTLKTQIASVQSAVSSLASVLNSTVVFATTVTVATAQRPALFACPTTGCSAPMTPFATETVPTATKSTSLSVHGANVAFFSTSGGLSWSVCNANGSCGAPKKTGQNNANAFALDPTDIVFFFDNGKLASCPLTENCMRTDYGASSLLPASMQAGASLVLWLTSNTGMTAGSGKLNACTRSSGCATPVPVTGGLDNPTNLVADANGAYWIGGAKIQHCANDCTGGAMDLATNLSTPSSLVADETFLYWAEPDGVYRLAR